mmetsp:Transcript_43919/g.133781  ORF Transcript_43919/g.133781 Transcript_43919/m.133781 type:complete len:85 (-) Transcript_43919:2584-2838(-)
MYSVNYHSFYIYQVCAATKKQHDIFLRSSRCSHAYRKRMLTSLGRHYSSAQDECSASSSLLQQKHSHIPYHLHAAGSTAATFLV